MVQRELAGVVGHDPAGVDDHALDPRALPVLPPPGDVVSGRVALGDVGLSPAEHAAIPRNFRCDRRRRGNGRGGGCM